MSAADSPLSDASVKTQVIHDLYADQIGRYCRRRLRSREDAEDAAQIVFLTAQRCLENGVEPRSERAWLFKIAEHVVLGQWRTLRQRAKHASPVNIDELADSAAARGRLPELVDLPAALARVPAAQRRALVLREWHGLSYAEVAEELRVTAATVETLIFRARGSLAKELGEPVRRSGTLRSLGLLPSAPWIFGGSVALKAAVGVAPLAVLAWAVLVPQQPASADSVTRAPAAALRGSVVLRSRQPAQEVHVVPAPPRGRSAAVRVVGQPPISSVSPVTAPPETAPATPQTTVNASDIVSAGDVSVADRPAVAAGDAAPAFAPAAPERRRAAPPVVRNASTPSSAEPADDARALPLVADAAPGQGAPSGAGVPAAPHFAVTPAPDGAGPSRTGGAPCSRECSSPSESAAHAGKDEPKV